MTASSWHHTLTVYILQCFPSTSKVMYYNWFYIPSLGGSSFMENVYMILISPEMEWQYCYLLREIHPPTPWDILLVTSNHNSLNHSLWM